MPDTRLSALEERTRYTPADVEERIFERWSAAGIFHPEPDADASESYSIAVPPPNVTGALHMGHALNGAIQDALIRLRRMQGRRVKWIFGTDHAGIATQVKVEQMLREQGTSRQEIGREAFVARVWEWREQYGSTIVEQFKRLGASADYADERFTMDPDYARAVTHVFVALFDKGLIYRERRSPRRADPRRGPRPPRQGRLRAHVPSPPRPCSPRPPSPPQPGRRLPRSPLPAATRGSTALARRGSPRSARWRSRSSFDEALCPPEL